MIPLVIAAIVAAVVWFLVALMMNIIGSVG